MYNIKNLRIVKIQVPFILICIFLFSCSSREDTDLSTPKTNTTERPSFPDARYSSADQAYVSSIDGIVNSLYDSITFGKNEKPDLARFRSLCAPQAPFIRIRGDGVDKMDLESFVSSFQERVRAGALKSFCEEEIFRKSHRYGSIAQVFSTYQKRMNTDDPEASIRGINSIQLFHDGERWWISCIMWEDERPDNPLPDDHLGKKRE